MLLISSPARTNTLVQTDTQIRRGMTTLRQAMDDYLVALGPLSSDLAEWLQIWAKPLCKSTLKPTTTRAPPPPPHCQPLPITALWLTMPSIINIKPSKKQKRSDIIENRNIKSSFSYSCTVQCLLTGRPPPIIFGQIC